MGWKLFWKFWQKKLKKKNPSVWTAFATPCSTCLCLLPATKKPGQSFLCWCQNNAHLLPDISWNQSAVLGSDSMFPSCSVVAQLNVHRAEKEDTCCPFWQIMRAQMVAIITIYGDSYAVSGRLMVTTQLKHFLFAFNKSVRAPSSSKVTEDWTYSSKLSLNLHSLLKVPVLSPGTCLYSLVRTGGEAW